LKFLEPISRAYQAFIQSGKKHAKNEEEAAKIVRLNYCILVVLVGITMNYTILQFIDLPLSLIIQITFSIVIFASFLLNRYGYNKFAMHLTFFSCIAINSIGGFVEGNIAGNYLLSIPLLMGVPILSSFNTSKHTIFIYIFVLIASLLLNFWLAPWQSQLQNISEAQGLSMHNGNFILTAILCCLTALMIKNVREQREQSLRNEKMFLNVVFNNSINGVIILKRDGRTIVDCNLKALSLLGIDDKQSLKYSSLDALVSAGGASLQNIVANQLKANTWEGGICLTPANGSLIFCDANLIAFSYMKKTYYKFSFMDVTDMKKAIEEQELANKKAIQAVADKSLFLSNISHELRTPLNGIKGTTNLLLMDNTPHGFAQEFDVLQNAADKMIEVINNVLDYNKLEAEKMQLEKSPFSLPQLLLSLDECFGSIAQAKNLQFAIDSMIVGEQNYLGDYTKLKQILFNLVHNAIKFTGKGHVLLTVSSKAAGDGFAQLSFKVEDTGIGIPEELHEGIREGLPQYNQSVNRAYSGVGVGLAISQKLLALHNSTLRFTTGIYKGTKFEFDLVLATAAETIVTADVLAQDQENLDRLQQMKLLVVEDNPINMSITRQFLKKLGVAIDEATDGEAALTLFSVNHYDLLLIDLHLPKKSGIELISAIRATNTEVPALAFTASAKDLSKSELLQMGFTDILPKPFTPQQITQKLLQYSFCHATQAS
jgi:signal transduction histidine kinase/CheY-like chemotaxis protein